MSSTAPVEPIALQSEEGESLWVFGGLATIKASGKTTDGGVTVVETLAPRGAGSPLHVHHREDEWFYVTEGELTFWVGGEVIAAPAGSFVYGPHDIPPHVRRHLRGSSLPARRRPGGFDDFMRAAGEPAQSLTIPPPPSEPPDPAKLGALAAEYGIEILGPPGIPS